MNALSGSLPLHRTSSAEDIAQLIGALLSAESMTGQVIGADNEQTL